MQIRRIAIERFGRLDGQEFEFGAGLNLIKGRNEAGKSTLREAILFALLGNPRHTTIQMQRDKRVDDRTTWGADRRFRLAMEFVDVADVPHTLVKDWCAQDACLTNCQTGERMEDPDRVQSELGRMLGCGSLKLFRSTACVEQDAIEEVSSGRREIGDQLQGIVTGGADEATVSSVLSRLDDKIKELERGVSSYAPRNPGPIKIVQGEMADIAARLADVRQEVEQAERATSRLVELVSDISAAELELESKRAVRDLCDRRFDYERQRDDARKKEEELEGVVTRVQNAGREVEQAVQALAGYATIGLVDEDAERKLTRLHERATTLREGVEERTAGLEDLRARSPTADEEGPSKSIPPTVAAAVCLA